MELVATTYQIKAEFETSKPGRVYFVCLYSPYYEGERWAVRDKFTCLNKNGEWQYDPFAHESASGDPATDGFTHDPTFYGLCRFKSLPEAHAAYRKVGLWEP